MHNINKKNEMFRKGQVVVELAVFGAILVFMVGIIVRQALMSGYRQNAILRTMRQAMTISHQYTRGDNASRNVTSLLLIEDRLTSDSGKYGATDRIPFVIQGIASHTRNLFLPVEAGEAHNLPVFDVIVNGDHFAFSTSAFIGIGSSGPFYKKVYNTPSSPSWCASGCPLGNLTEEQRFDLDRSDLDRQGFPGTTPGAEVPAAERTTFSWQWMQVFNPARGMFIDVDKDLKEESVSSDVTVSVVYVLDGSGNPIMDPVLDGSGNPIMVPKRDPRGFPTSILVPLLRPRVDYMIYSMTVLDSQAGDVDFSINTYDVRRGQKIPGFTSDMQMYAVTRDGTYLQIDEGKLYGPNQQFIRNASRKDSTDVVVRMFQLSNDTNNLCDASGNRVPSFAGGGNNPVEACNNCFSSANVFKTCFDEASKMLYIRSRILDRHGRKWVTDVTSDPTVDFQIPTGL
jgi:hypothetical protein